MRFAAFMIPGYALLPRAVPLSPPPAAPRRVLDSRPYMTVPVCWLARIMDEPLTSLISSCTYHGGRLHFPLDAVIFSPNTRPYLSLELMSATKNYELTDACLAHFEPFAPALQTYRRYYHHYHHHLAALTAAVAYEPGNKGGRVAAPLERYRGGNIFFHTSSPRGPVLEMRFFTKHKKR